MNAKELMDLLFPGVEVEWASSGGIFFDINAIHFDAVAAKLLLMGGVLEAGHVNLLPDVSERGTGFRTVLYGIVRDRAGLCGTVRNRAVLYMPNLFALAEYAGVIPCEIQTIDS